MYSQEEMNQIKNSLTMEQIFHFLETQEAEPCIKDNIIISKTICHNHKGEGSHKLYYYDNTKLFKCYTDCDDTFDIFELVVKIKTREEKIKYSLYNAINYVKCFFGLQDNLEDSDFFIKELKDWQIFQRYDNQKEKNTPVIELKKYDKNILKYLPRPRIIPWEKEGIKPNIIEYQNILYNPLSESIVIPHFDIDNNLIGIRERTLVKEIEKSNYGKYHPAIFHGQMYNHPLGFSLYNLNNSKNNIKKIQKAIIWESEKSSLLYESYFGIENDITCACCGSSIQDYQIYLLLSLGVKEIIIGFDKQYQTIRDEEWERWTKKLIKIHKKYSPYVTVSFLFDKDNNVLSYKSSPIDEGPEKFLKLYNNRIFL